MVYVRVMVIGFESPSGTSSESRTTISPQFSVITTPIDSKPARSVAGSETLDKHPTVSGTVF